MKIQLSDHFSYSKLIKFTLPTIAMMIFTSIYGVVDGVFVSNCVGSDAFAAVNLIMPIIMILGSVGFMIGTGGSAIVSKTLGEGKKEKANEYFSMLVYLCVVSGVILSVIGIIFTGPIAVLLGAKGSIAKDCVTYGRTVFFMLTGLFLQNAFQSFLVVAEKPKLGLFVTLLPDLLICLWTFYLYMFTVWRFWCGTCNRNKPVCRFCNSDYIFCRW